jgi:hypothetical protein
MSCGLGVGPSQISLFGEPEAGLIPPNFVFVVWVYAQKGVASYNLKFFYKLAAFC